MTVQDIYQFFQSPPMMFLNQELTVCYILSILKQRDSYGTELIHLLETQYDGYRLSDTVLYRAFQFLEQERLITSYWQKVQGRGRPRRMYQICPDMRPEADRLAQLWRTYVQSHHAQPDTLKSAFQAAFKPVMEGVSAY